jgi:hypothetical protein
MRVILVPSEAIEILETPPVLHHELGPTVEPVGTSRSRAPRPSPWRRRAWRRVRRGSGLPGRWWIRLSSDYSPTQRPIFPVSDVTAAMEHYRRRGFATREYEGGGLRVCDARRC